MIAGRHARLRVETDKDLKLYRVWFEIFDGMVLLGSYKIPSQAIIDTFTEISVREHNGFTDALGETPTIRLEDNLKEML